MVRTPFMVLPLLSPPKQLQSDLKKIYILKDFNELCHEHESFIAVN